jgi:hypothetical protein
MALSQNEPNAIVCCEDSQIYGLSGLCSLPKVRIEECRVLNSGDRTRHMYHIAHSSPQQQCTTILILSR